MWAVLVAAGLGFIAGVAVVDLLWIYSEMKNAPEMEDPDVIQLRRRDDD